MNAKPMTRTLLLSFLLSVAAPAFAIYKCEAGGKVIYSDEPCADGKVLDIGSTLPVDAAQAKRQVAQEKKQAKRLEGERNRREAKEERERQHAARTGAARQKKCATLARRQKWAGEDVASATGKSTDKARRKAQRAAEEYQAECGQPNVRELSVAG